MATIWITGASSGIGAVLALRLAQDGHEVAASARGAERLARLSDQAREADGRIHAYPLDVTDRGAAAAVLAEIERELGPVDTAVLAAGTHHPVSARDFKAEDLRGLQSTRFEINFPRRFTYILKLARCLPYGLHFPLVARATRKQVLARSGGMRRWSG